MNATATDTGPRRTALLQAARVAGLAPSIHNTQPWRWRLIGPVLELYAQRSRQLDASDPTGRLLVLSCGAALRHVETALAADGWSYHVHRLPSPDHPDLLATVTLTERSPATPDQREDLEMLRRRHTDRRPVSGAPVPPIVTDELAAVADLTGAHLHILHHAQVMELASAADRAQRIESTDPAWQAELAFWAGGARADGLGVPGAAIPAEAPQTTVPARDFGHTGGLPIGDGHDATAAYAILYGGGDTPLQWLRAGEALVAVWSRALARGMAVVPLSATVEVETTRLALRRLLANLGDPYLVLRIGAPGPADPGPAYTPRLPSDQVIDVVEPVG